MILRCQQFQAAEGPVEDALAAYAVVGLGGPPIQADLEVKRVKLFEAAGTFWRDQCPVGTDAHDKATSSAALQHLPDAGVNKWFSAAKMDLENLHFRQLINKGEGLLRCQFARTAASR